LLRLISEEPNIILRVIFENNPENLAYYDPGFDCKVEWDTPLTDGYNNEYLSNTNLDNEIRNADVLWLHGWGSSVFRKGLRIAKRHGVPVLMRGENCDIAMPDGYGLRGWLKRRYINWILKHCSAFLAIGSENQKYYLDRGVENHQIFMTPYAIDNESFILNSNSFELISSDFKSGLGISSEQKIILFVGKLIPRKRPDIIIKALNKIDWKGNTKPALVFVGDGEMREELVKLAPAAIFLGFKNQSELPAIYNIADVLILPSQREPWGLVVNEAMACATAIIASDEVGCATDLLNNGCGKVFPSGDVSALANSIVYCIKNSDTMGKISQITIKKWGFSEDIIGLKEAINYLDLQDVDNT
jgi:glycosyltransferase involved in cell wall biosynthesis